MKTRNYLILMAAFLLVPVVGLSWIGLNRLLAQERESRLQAVRETVRATALAIDQEIADAEGALRILANTDYLRNADFPRLYDLMKEANRQPYSWTVVFDYQGNVVVNTLLPFGAKYPDPNYPWAASIIDNQESTVSDLRIGAVSKTPVISVNVPVPASGGRKYVVSQIFQTDHFNRLLNSRSISPTWVVGLFGADGISIARNVEPEKFIGKPVRRELYEASLQSYSGETRHVTRENVAVYGVFTHTDRTGWTVAIGVPEQEIEAPARRATLYAALAMGLLFALAALAVLALARRLARALDGAVEAAHILGQGRIPEAQATRVVEVDVLQSALHEAGVALSKENLSRQYLEKERESLLLSEQEARKQAESQNRAKDEFLAMLGHELRNPLGAISSAFAIMELPNAGPDQVARARTIGRRQVDHLSRVVDDLLDVSRIMAGKIELKKQPLELGAFAQRCVDALRAIHHDSHRWTVHTQAVWVNADPTRLEQIIGNVLSNAVRYTPGNGSIDVAVRADGDDAIVEVRDSGIGITEDLLPRIFEVFVQGPTTIDRTQGGLGLGLALVQRLLSLHGGTVTAASAGAGLGSVFTLRLPRHHEAALAPAEEKPVRRAAGTPHVLVVEDNEDGRTMLSALLALHGFATSVAGNGRQALDLAASDRPDVAIVDIGLPDFSGYEVARRLRADPATAGIRLIALTGYGLEQDRQQAAEAGFAVHLTKPYSAERLLEAIAGPE